MINVVIRAINVIRCLSDGINGLIEISEKLNLSKGTVHRILETLEITGMVVQDPKSRKYYLGLEFFSLSSTITQSHQGLVACAFETMWNIRELTGESVALQIRSGQQRILLEELESRQNHRFTLGRDYMAPLYTGSGGIVMLSQLSQNELESLLNSMEIIKTGPGAVEDRTQLLEQIEIAKQRGYAITISSVHYGTAGISVPIFNYICPVALSVFGPENRLDNMKKHILVIKEGGEKISRKVYQIFKKTKGGRDCE